jgi:hypothetical protein
MTEDEQLKRALAASVGEELDDEVEILESLPLQSSIF